jgi:RNA polymerase sigma factor (sigma-70 family)
MNDVPHSEPRPLFTTTHWSVVLCAQGQSQAAQEALNLLCASYWYPLYAFIRRQGVNPHDSQDLTQEFFSRLLATGGLHTVNPNRGRFRSWLLAALKHFLANQWDKARAIKRGGAVDFISFDAAEERYAIEPVETNSADQIYERRWALTLLERVLEELRIEMDRGGRSALFEALKFCLTGQRGPAYSALAMELGLSEGAVKVAVHRMRDRYRDLIRAEVGRTVESPAEVDAEMQALFEALR